MNRFHAALALVCTVGIWASPLAVTSRAEGWTNWLARRVEADPNKDYRLSEENGPWMILATSFSGEGAEQQARDLTLELRQRFKVEAYMWIRVFDHTGRTPSGRIDPYGEEVMLKNYRFGSRREIAVLVGNYPAVKDANAQAMLQKLKYADLQSMRVKKDKVDYQMLGGLRVLQKRANRWLGQGHAKKAQRGRLGTAFIAVNPLLPKDYFKQRGLDPMVVRINSRVKYSLLECGGKYTVQVATFRGAVSFAGARTSNSRRNRPEQEFGSQLAKAAARANKLTLALRKKGVEAYEFHDRNQSIVCVGGFNSYGQPRRDGKIEINPAIHQIMQRWGAPMQAAPGTPTEAIGRPKQLAGIPFDVQPKIVEVPKAPVQHNQARAGGFGLFR
ncbi:MAG: hypothetical protein N2C14_18850 [Planctomycetales bacterium]